MTFCDARLRGTAPGSTALALLLVSSPAIAQQASPGDASDDEDICRIDTLEKLPSECQIPNAPQPATAYPPSFFKRFAPRNALDMLDQVPGFSIKAESTARGLGQASGNVLINGQRLSSKSDSALDQLSRVPAGDVVRIEIMDGASLDIPGLSGRVANIVVKSSGISGQFEWRPQLPTDYAAGRWSRGKLSVSGTYRAVDYTLALSNDAFRGGTGGPVVFTDANGTVTETRFSRTHPMNDEPKLSGSFHVGAPGELAANLNLSYQWRIFRSRQLDDRFAPAMPVDPFSLRTLRTNDNGHNYEIGGDIAFPLGPGRLKLIGLDRFKTSDFRTQEVFDFADGSPSTGSRFTLASDSGERIARAEYSWSLGGAEWQLSAEGAFNRLDNVAGLFALDPSGDFAEIPFPQGTGGVTEDRYEAILSYGRPLSDKLTMQLALGGEYSKIAQTGSHARTRSFKRPKGSLSLAWDPADDIDVSLELRRAVGQLDFGDFLADVNLEVDNTNAGNNELKPPQSWEAELEIAKRLGGWGSATIKFYEHRISDFVTIVPLPGPNPGELVESKGNIDSARLRGVSLKGTILFDLLGWKGAKLDIDANFQKSKLTDPVTGETRSFDYTRPHNLQVDFRHDIPGSRWAWGLEFRNTKFAPYYRLAEYGWDYTNSTFGAVFVENKDVFGLTARVRMANLFNGKSVLYRTVYAGPRGSSPVLFVEDQRRSIGIVWNFLLKGNF